MIVNDDKRIRGEHSLHAEYDPSKCPRNPGGPWPFAQQCGEWRVVDCRSGGAGYDDIDTLECSRCGKQITTPCTFDDDYA